VTHFAISTRFKVTIRPNVHNFRDLTRPVDANIRC